MKKVILLAAVVAALVSCQSKTNSAAMAAADSLAIDSMMPVVEATEVFEGTLPATKTAPAVNYVLTLDMMADSNDTVYTLDMTYLDANQQPTTKKMTIKGKPQMVQKMMKDAKKKPVAAKAMKLNPSDGSAPLYFVVTNDTTLTLMNDSLQETISDMGFNIVRVK
ncbi:MAG: copper resistance protein NlpE N-terminal domain-containing protein [Bacteroides sp.]